MLPGLFSGGPGRRSPAPDTSPRTVRTSHRPQKAPAQSWTHGFPGKGDCREWPVPTRRQRSVFSESPRQTPSAWPGPGCPAGQPQIDGQWSVLRQRQPIAIDADQNCACSIPFYNGKPLHRCTRRSSPVGRHCDHSHISLSQRNTGKIFPSICQIHRHNRIEQSFRQYACRSLGPSCRAERNFISLHLKRPPSCLFFSFLQ